MELANMGCERILIVDKENNNTYEISFELFLDKKFEIDLGYGKQFACADGNFSIKNSKQMELI